MMELHVKKTGTPDLYSVSLFFKEDLKFEKTLRLRDLPSLLEEPVKKILDVVTPEEKPVPFFIRTDDPGAEAVPLRFIHDGEKLSSWMSSDLFFMRSLFQESIMATPSPPLLPAPVRTLFLISRPWEDSAQRDPDGEGERILSGLHRLMKEGECEVDFLANPTAGEVRAILKSYDYPFVHFIGEGGMDADKGKGFLVFHKKEKDQMERLYPDDVAGMLTERGSGQWLLLSLDTEGKDRHLPLWTSSFAGEVLKKRPHGNLAVAPMPDSQEAAAGFLESLYGILTEGAGVDRAMLLAWKGVLKKFPDMHGGGTPQLYLGRRGTAPEGESTPAAKEESPSPVLNLSNLPDLGPRFVGRNAPLKIMARTFDTHEQRCLFLHGPPGIGKSSLSAKFVMERPERFKAATVIKLERHTPFAQVLDNLARFIDYVEGGTFYHGFYSQVRNMDRKVDEIFTELRRQPYLIILDNLDSQIMDGKIVDKDLEVFVVGFMNVVKYRSVLLVTSAKKVDFDKKLQKHLREIPVGPFALLETIYSLNVTDGLRRLDLKEKILIHEAMGGHPLALSLFGTFWEKEGQAAFQLLEKEEFGDPEEVLDFMISAVYERLSEGARQAADSVWVFYDEVIFDFYVSLMDLSGQGKIVELNRSLKELAAAGLLDSYRDSFQMHPKVRSFLRERNHAREKELSRKAGIVYFRHSRNYPEDIWYHVKASEYFLEAEEPQLAAEVVSDVVHLLDAAGLWEYARKLCEKFRGLTEGKFQTFFLLSLAKINMGRNLLDDAEENYRDLLKGAGEKEKAHYCHQLGSIAEIKKDFREARGYYNQSLELSRKVGDKAGEARTLHQMGILFETREEYDEALKCYERSLEIKKEEGDAQGRLYSLGQMGLFFLKRSNFKEALRHTFEAFALACDEKMPEGEKVLEQIYELRGMQEEEKFYEIVRVLGIDHEFRERIGHI